MENREKEVLNQINSSDVIDLAKELIRIPSHRDTQGEEERVGRFLVSHLQKEGINSHLQEVADNRSNVIAKVEGSSKTGGLILNGHLDTVPPSEKMREPYNPKIEDNKLFGRGAVDMKGGVAAMAHALIAIKRADIKLSKDLIFTGVIGEESGSPGTKHLLKHGPKAEMAIVGEPTNLNIVVAHKGIERLRILLSGKAAHSSRPDLGVNAITNAAKVIKAIEDKIVPILNTYNHHMLGKPTLNIGFIRGGEERPNVVPSRCEIKIDRRWIPGESIPDILKEFQDVLDGLHSKDEKFQAIVERDPTQGLIETPHKPLDVSNRKNLIDLLKASLLKLDNQEPEVVGVDYWTDAALLNNKGGIPTAVFGPGSIDQAHTDSEFIDLNQLTTAARAYTLIGLKKCTGMDV